MQKIVKFGHGVLHSSSCSVSVRPVGSVGVGGGDDLLKLLRCCKYIRGSYADETPLLGIQMRVSVH